MPESVRPKMPKLRGACGPLKFPPHARVGVRESAEFDRARKYPVLSSGEIRTLFTCIQSLQQFARQTECPGGAFRLYVGNDLFNDPTPNAQSSAWPIYIRLSERKRLTDAETQADAQQSHC